MNGMDKQAHYQITEERGKGIFGAFFRATDLKNQQDISLHALYPHLTAEPGVMGMLHDAAQTVKGLDHPNLVPVLGFEPNFLQGVILLQNMPGGSLADLLNTRQRPDPTRAEAMIMQLSTAMAYLHRNQIVLHGLHPSAIHFDELGVARLANVVVAKLLSMAGADDMLPMRQALAGSPYCAPELRQGGKGTYSTDIYSLGLIFYDILRGESIETRSEPSLGLGEGWLKEIEARWQPVLWQCLLPDPQDRFQNAEALFEAIKSAAGQRQAQGFKPASMFKPDGSARPFFRPLGAGQAPGQVVRSSEGATPPIAAQPSPGAKQVGQEPVAGGVPSSVPLQGQAMDTSWQGQARAHQPLAQGGRETGQDSSVPGQGMEATRQDELRHEREVVRFAPDAARMGRQAGTQMPVSSYGAARSETKQAIQLSKPSIGTSRSVLEARRKKVNRRFWALLIGLITILVILFLLLFVWSKGRKNPHQENDNNPPPTVKDIGKENVPLYIEATSTFDQRHYVSTPDPSSIPSTETMPTEDSQTAVNNPEQDRRQSKTNVRWQDGMEMVYVPEGEFTMGSTDSDARDEESPVREVRLDAYWIDKYEVSNAQYQKCVNAGKCTEPGSTVSWIRASYYGNTEYDDFPVITVNWHQAKAYCEWVGGSLPTEAQWEKAARGTDARKYPWGVESPNCERANYSPDWSNNVKCVGDTERVGTYPAGASPYGAMDMAGNVWEWVLDWYGPYDEAETNNPEGPASGYNRVMRGGSWINYSRLIRSTYRGVYDPASKGEDIGFRCVLPEP